MLYCRHTDHIASHFDDEYRGIRRVNILCRIFSLLLDTGGSQRFNRRLLPAAIKQVRFWRPAVPPLENTVWFWQLIANLTCEEGGLRCGGKRGGI